MVTGRIPAALCSSSRGREGKRRREEERERERIGMEEGDEGEGGKDL